MKPVEIILIVCAVLIVVSVTISVLVKKHRAKKSTCGGACSGNCANCEKYKSEMEKMNNINLFDTVELLEELCEGKDYISLSKQNIKKGSNGIVVDIINDKFVSVEFSNKDYKDPVTTVAIDKLKKVE